MHDLVIRNGVVIDGSGAPRRSADVAINDGIISIVGEVQDAGRREIDATDRLVTPGWVDMHTHYDAQATWDPELTPSGWHGVTTVVMGNCGVGFAPVSPDQRQFLIEVMEGVEDIPGAALTDGISWDWQTFPEYLDALERHSWVCDIGTQVPHVALRTFVMGQAGAGEASATTDQTKEMRRLATEALGVGALGISSSRTPLHKTIHGELVPGTFAEEAELLELGRAIADAGHGVFQVALHHPEVPTDFSWMRNLAEASGRRVTFNFSQIDAAPDVWKDVLPLLNQAHNDGLQIYGQLAGRAVGILMSWEGTVHPFIEKPTWKSIAGLAKADRLDHLRQPEIRQAILDETNEDASSFIEFVTTSFNKMYPFSGETDYEPGPDRSIGALADRSSANAASLAYDLMLEEDGNGLLYFPLMNYTDGNLDVLHHLHQQPHTLMGLADAGAHCGAICDGGMPTFMLTHWTRDRSHNRLDLEFIVHRQTRQTAEHYGLLDRGLLAPGMKADVNVIDFDRLNVEPARVAYDLPTGARRYVQAGIGYDATVVSGTIVREHDEFTGAYPGKLLRGPQSSPNTLREE